jgi:hypothetical membrane protein
MAINKKNIAGYFLIIGSIQFMLSILISESLYQGYNVSLQALSDLGVGKTALIFNISIIMAGLMIIFAVYYINNVFKDKIPLLFMLLMGTGMIGVGAFPETTLFVHIAFSLIVFIFGTLSVLFSLKLVKFPIRYIFLALGLISAISLIAVLFGVSLGLGSGGIERLLVYPMILWGILFGSYLTFK